MASEYKTVKASGAKKAASAGGDWDYLTIRKAQNGFEITKGFDWKPNQKKQPEQPKPYLAKDAMEADAYTDECLGVPVEKGESDGNGSGKKQ